MGTFLLLHLKWYITWLYVCAVFNNKNHYCFVAHLVVPLTCSDLKADESISEELEAAYVCKRRLEHLREHAGSNVPAGSGSSTGTVNLWRKRRLDRMLVEYFLRRGYYGAATRLAHRSDLRDLTNIGIDNLLHNL